jgi:hypothetical protein
MNNLGVFLSSLHVFHILVDSCSVDQKMISLTQFQSFVVSWILLKSYSIVQLKSNGKKNITLFQIIRNKKYTRQMSGYFNIKTKTDRNATFEKKI